MKYRNRGMTMKAVKMSGIMIAALVGLLGCSNLNTNKSEKTAISIQSVGLSDSSGAKWGSMTEEVISNTSLKQFMQGHKQAIASEYDEHRNTYLSMNRELADQVMQQAHLGSTSIAMTDTNIYVAVDMGDLDDAGKLEREKLLSKYNDPATEAGLFGSGVGAQMDWVSAKPITTDRVNTIRNVLSRIYPDSHIFISSNALFVNRMMYYDMQQRKNKRMDTYLHEFNTIVQYAFTKSQ
jgi:hypothetical protein